MEIIGSRAGYLWDGLCLVYEALGLDRAAGGDGFSGSVLARIIEPTSKVDSLRVLAETGIDSVTYRTLTRRCRATRRPRFVLLCRRPVPVMPGWDRRRWCSTT